MAASSESVLDDLLRKLGANAPPLPEPKMPSLYQVECKKGDMEPDASHEHLLQKMATLRLTKSSAAPEVVSFLNERRHLLGLVHVWTGRAWDAAEHDETKSYTAAMKQREHYLKRYNDCMRRMELFYLLNQY